MAKDSKQPMQPKTEDPYKQFTSVLPDGHEIPSLAGTATTTLPPTTDPTTLVVKAEDFDGTTTLLPSVPGDRFRDDADPMMVKAYSILERIQVGGLLSQWAGTVYVDISELLPEMRKAVMA